MFVLLMPIWETMCCCLQPVQVGGCLKITKSGGGYSKNASEICKGKRPGIKEGGCLGTEKEKSKTVL